MAWSSKRRLCPRCRQVVEGPCLTCSVGWAERKPKSWAGGSTRRWRKTRAQKLAASPWCEWPGCDRSADEVDHMDGADYATQRYDPLMLRSLCTPHHRIRTARQGRAARS